MPHRSDRELLIKELDSFFKFLILVEEDDSEDFNELMEVRMGIESVRYVNLRKYETKKRSMNDMLWNYSDSAFKQIVRMDKQSFLKY
jgi:hypothetical protein